MSNVTGPQTPSDSRQVVRSFNADGSANFSQVGIEEISYRGRFGAIASSGTSNDISIGEKYFTLDFDSGLLKTGDDVLIQSLDDPDCYMWGEIVGTDTVWEPLRLRVFVDDISAITNTSQNWEIQVVARPKPGIEKDTSTTSVNPTTGGPWTFTVTAGKFFPIGGTLLIKPTTDRSIALIGEVSAYNSTSLTVTLRDTNATVSQTYDSWSIALLDSPPAKMPLIAISGMKVSGSGSDITVKAGSVMDSTGTVLMTLGQNLTKSANAVFSAGAAGGAVIKVALTGTITDAAGTITGVGTNFLGDVVDSSSGVAAMNEFEDLGGDLSNWSFGTLYPMISAGGHGGLIYDVTSDTSMKTVDSITAAGLSYSRGALEGESTAGGNYFQGFIVIVRKDSDGTIDWCISTATPTGIPDLPSGYTYYRVIAGFVRKVADTTWYIIHHIHDAEAPFSPKDSRYYIAQEGDTRIPNSRVLSGSTSITITLSGGNYEIRRPALTGDVVALANSNTTIISADVVGNTELENMAAYTLKGRNAGTTGDPSDIDVTALTAQSSPTTTDYLLGVDTAASNAFKKYAATAIARERLFAGRTYYVRTDGSDSNTGLADSAGGAFLTLQKAYDTIITLDLGGYTVTVSVGDGTYTGGLSITKPWIGGLVTFQGNTTTPDNALISTSGTCISVSCVLPGVLTFTGFKITSSAGSGVSHSGVGFITLNKVNTGACANYKITVTRPGATVNVTGNYTDSGNAIRHFSVTEGGFLQTISITVTESGTPAYSGAYALASTGGVIIIFSTTYSGSATGTRYSADLNSVIQTFGGGANKFPGNAAGSTATGGQYA